MEQRIRLLTRASTLALTQAKLVKAALEQVQPGLSVELCPTQALGDRYRDRWQEFAQTHGSAALNKRKWTFELEEAIANGEYDLAIEWFNKSYHGKLIRSNFKQRMVAIFLTICLASLVILSIALIITSEVFSYYLVKKSLVNNSFNIMLLMIGKYLILLALCITAISLLYYAGPSHRQRMKFISAGSSLATILVIITSIGFNFFITHFATYNKVYGSIGTLMIILVWLYFNSLVLLIGFELNVAIDRAKKHHGGILKK